jgi:uncharacterized YigZ family protein
MTLAYDQYRTITGQVHSKLTEKRSKFLGWMEAIASEADVDEFLARVSDEHHNPTHIVYAYRLRQADGVKEYCTDDGEPSHSAGQPVLKVLRGNELENVICAVIRYYGGVKLGVGGLIRAYSETAKLCVEYGETVVKTITQSLTVTVKYSGIGMVVNLVEELGGSVETMEYAADSVKIFISLRKSLVDTFEKKYESDIPFHLKEECRKIGV